ncbi:MAG: hypothetical protein ABIR54_03010 [Burkholderiaceae bacterium]
MGSRVIVFDLDGTISDPLPGFARSINQALRLQGFAERKRIDLAESILQLFGQRALFAASRFAASSRDEPVRAAVAARADSLVTDGADRRPARREMLDTRGSLHCVAAAPTR